MRKIIVFFAVFFSLIVQMQAQERGYVEGEIIVRFRSNVSRPEIDGIARAQGARVVRAARAMPSIFLLEVPEPSASEIMSALRMNPQVVYAQRNHRITIAAVPNDPFFSMQWALESTRAEVAWDTTTGSSSIIGGIIDTGIDPFQEDIIPNLYDVPGDPMVANGGWDFVLDQAPTSDRTIHNHGTHVASIIGARGNNATGVAGMMWNVQLANLQTSDPFNSGDLFEFAIIDAIGYAIQREFDLLNCSFALPLSQILTAGTCGDSFKPVRASAGGCFYSGRE